MEKSCVVIGSGLMVPSLLSTLLPMGFSIKLLGNVESELKALNLQFSVPTFISDVNDTPSIINHIQGASVVISMVPPRFHHLVLKACIAAKINLVTPSYVSTDMLALEAEAKAAGIVVLNENGLDPGIDHMSVIVKLEDIQKAGGKVIEFQSSCGAFPSPDSCNKMCYKLAWAPYGALLAVTRPAKYLKNGEITEVNGKDLMWHAEEYPLNFERDLMQYPNGDSTGYPVKYGLNDARTVIRSTLRYSNTPIVCKALSLMGIYNESPREFPAITWAQLTEELAGEEETDQNVSEKYSSALHKKIVKKTADPGNALLILEVFEELGLLSDSMVSGKSVFDAFVNLVYPKLEYLPGERDCVVMEHRFLAQFDGKKVLFKSRLVEYGVPNGGTSAVSRLVSVPTALAADWILQNDHEAGFMYPMEEKFAKDVLGRLKREYSVEFLEEEEVV